MLEDDFPRFFPIFFLGVEMILLPCVLTRSLLPFPPLARGVCRDGAGSSRRSRRRVCVAVVALVRYTEMCVCVSVCLCVCVCVCVCACVCCVWTQFLMSIHGILCYVCVCVLHTSVCVFRGCSIRIHYPPTPSHFCRLAARPF